MDQLHFWNTFAKSKKPSASILMEESSTYCPPSDATSDNIPYLIFFLKLTEVHINLRNQTQCPSYLMHPQDSLVTYCWQYQLYINPYTFTIYTSRHKYNLPQCTCTRRETVVRSPGRSLESLDTQKPLTVLQSRWSTYGNSLGHSLWNAVNGLGRDATVLLDRHSLHAVLYNSEQTEHKSIYVLCITTYSNNIKFNFSQYQRTDWPGRASSEWPILCQIGH